MMFRSVKGILIPVSVFGMVACGGDQSNSVPPVNVIQKLPNIYLQPQRFIGQSSQSLSKNINKPSNAVGNIVFEEQGRRFLFESTDGNISFVEITFTETAPCDFETLLDSKSLLKAVGIEQSDLEPSNIQTHSRSFYDHTNRLKVRVSCVSETEGYTVSFSKKYYGL